MQRAAFVWRRSPTAWPKPARLHPRRHRQGCHRQDRRLVRLSRRARLHPRVAVAGTMATSCHGHIASSPTSKRWALGVYHRLRRNHLQSYFDAFVFRFNRRKTRHAAFHSLLGIAVTIKHSTYKNADPTGSDGRTLISLWCGSLDGRTDQGYSSTALFCKLRAQEEVQLSTQDHRQRQYQIELARLGSPLTADVLTGWHRRVEQARRWRFGVATTYDAHEGTARA
jgi:hypothetical protein